MKPLHALLALAALAFAAPVSSQPGIDDPELMAWMQSANAAQQERLEALAARDDAQSQLMAMTLVHPIFPLREDPEGEIAAEQARAWALLERAAQLDPDHPVVAWKLATCPADSGLAACGSPGSRERLQAVAGARAEARLWLAQVARAVGDEAALETHLQAAAEAPRFNAFHDQQSELFWQAWEGIDFPPAAPAVVASYRQHIELDPDAFIEQLVVMSVNARMAASLLLNFSFPVELCEIGDQARDLGERRRRQCEAIFTTMGNDEPSLLQRMVADQAMVELAADGPGADASRARLLTTAWVLEAGVPLTASLSTRHDPGYFEWWREAGEYQALLRLMQRRGVDHEPPEGWLPEDARRRELLEGDTGEPDAGASAPDTSGEDAQGE